MWAELYDPLHKVILLLKHFWLNVNQLNIERLKYLSNINLWPEQDNIRGKSLAHIMLVNINWCNVVWGQGQETEQLCSFCITALLEP